MTIPPENIKPYTPPPTRYSRSAPSTLSDEERAARAAAAEARAEALAKRSEENKKAWAERHGSGIPKPSGAGVDIELIPAPTKRKGRQPKDNLEEWKPTQDDLNRVEEYASEGMKDGAIANCFGFNPRSMATRREQCPEFDQAILRGRSAHQLFIVKNLNKRVKDGDTIAAIFLAKSVHDFRDKPDETKVVLEQKIQYFLPETMPQDDWTRMVEQDSKRTKAVAENKLLEWTKSRGFEGTVSSIVEAEVEEINEQTATES
jgi:hypothetical protein